MDFDRGYFEKAADGAHRSNYTRVGGYARHARSVDWAAAADRLGVEAGDHVLDAGCAYGHLVAELRKRGVEAYGLDISAFAVGQAAPEVREFLMVGDVAEGLPPVPGKRPSKKWDLVVSLDLLEHFDAEAAAAVMAAMAGRARRQFHKVNTGEFAYQAFGGDATHRAPLPLDRWRALAAEVAERAGCEIEVERT